MNRAKMTGWLLLIVVVGAWGSAMADPSPGKPYIQSAALVNLVMKDVTVKQAIEKLFEGRNLKYNIDPGVTGNIRELTLKGVTFGQALKGLGDAADFSYKVENGTYTIFPTKVTVSSTARREQNQPSPEEQPQGQPPMGYSEPEQMGPPPGAPLNTGNSVIVEQSGPVYYGHPGPPDVYGGGYGPYGGGYPPFSAGNVGVVGSGFGGSVVILPGGNLRGTNVVYPPPPPGWVSPEMLRFLRNQWALSPVRNYPPPYGY